MTRPQGSRLLNVAELTTGFPFKSTEFSSSPDDPRLLRGDNVQQRHIRWTNAARWPTERLDDLDDYALRQGDVVLAMDRPWVQAGLKVAVVREDDLPCYLVQRVARLRALSSALDQRYLYYVLCDRDFTHYVLSVQTGTSVPHISGRQIQDYKVPLPDLDMQRAIAGVLAALDDQIELIRQTNHTLEEMASALFTSWFIDFDPVVAKADGRVPFGMGEATAALFPDDFEESDEGPIPAGWEVHPVDSVVETVFDGPHATPPKTDEGPVFLGIRNMAGTRIDLAQVRHISETDWPRWTKRVTPQPGDIVFTYEATLGHFAIVPPGLRCCLGRRLALVRPQDRAHTHYLFHWFAGDPFQEVLKARSWTGSTVDRIPLTEFPSYPVLWPSEATRDAFVGRVRPMWELIHSNEGESRTLAALRDLLLPKLLSGEIRLKQAEKAVEAVL